MSNEYTLARRDDGRHFEEFCDLNDGVKLAAIVQRAKDGILDGHKPVPHERYAGRLYFPGENRVNIKLTKIK